MDGLEDGEETSLADDSYTSASESTLLTILDPQMHGSCADVRQIMSMSGGSEYSLNISMESLKDKVSQRWSKIKHLRALKIRVNDLK